MRRGCVRGARVRRVGVRSFGRRLFRCGGGVGLRGDGRHAESARRQSREKESIEFFVAERGTHRRLRRLGYFVSAGTTPGRNTIMVRSLVLLVPPRRRTLNTTFWPGLSLLTACRYSSTEVT